MTTALTAHAVTRRFKNGRGVGPVDITMRDGECLALMGPNGAGKTTLLRLVVTADRASSGRIEWTGAATARDVRRRLGYAPDTVVEEGALTARQATHFWCTQWTVRGDASARVIAALRMFELEGVADEPVSSFSFGMRRRLGLAQAMVHEPQMLVLDEPTAGLDPAGVDILRRVVRERNLAGCTTLIGSNDPDFVATACDRVVFLDDGLVVRDASPAALLADAGSARRAELDVGSTVDLSLLRGLDGVGNVVRVNGCVHVDLLDDRALPAVVAVADAPAGTLRGVTVHTPDLADAFRRLTGRALLSEPRST